MAADFQPRAIWDWLSTCPHIKDLYFAFGEAVDESTILHPVTAHKDRIVREFIDGSSIRHCDFALVRYQNVTTDSNTTVNIDIQQKVEALADWIDTQGDEGNFPEFPKDRHVQRVFSLPTEVGFLASPGVQGAPLAKFMLQFRIEYYYCKE